MPELKRTLGFWMTSAFIFLNLVNTGIFFGVPLAAAIAGIDSIVAWVILASMSVYTGMCFAELTTMFPSAGGVYEFAKQAYGRFTSFGIAWIIWLINNIATALLVVAAMEYLLPEASLTLWGFTFSGTVIRISLAILTILILNAITYWGASESARLMVFLAMFTLIIGILVIIPGAFALQMSHFHGFTFTWPLILLAAFLLSETFFGWESVSFMAEEIKDPEKTIPKAMNRTTLFVAAIALALVLVTYGVLTPAQLANGSITKPIISVLQEIGLSDWFILLANLGIVATFLGNAAGSIIGNPRLLMALSRDKLFIDQFAEIHPRFETPYRAIILQTIAALLVVSFASGNFVELLRMVIAPSIILYCAMLFLVPWFRWRRPEQPRPYRAPGGSWLPLVLVAAYTTLLATWIIYDHSAVMELRVLGSFILFCVPIYMLLTYFYDPDVLIKTMNKFAILSRFLEMFLVPKSLRRRIYALIPGAEGRNLLEFGAGVGSLTVELADIVGPTGTVTALDFSKHNVHILQKRLTRLGHRHVRVIHDSHLVNRVHPDVSQADVIVSLGALSYLQDTKKVLRELFTILAPRGRICMVEYIDMFWFLPNNPKWLSRKDEVQELFSQAGFSVRVEIRRGLLWKYLFVHGVKEKSGVPYI